MSTVAAVLVRYLLKKITGATTGEPPSELFVDAWGGLHTSSGGPRWHQTIDLSGNTTFAQPNTPRAVHVGVGGTVVIDSIDKDGALVTGITLKGNGDGVDVLLGPGCTKIYGSGGGTTATDLVAIG